MQYYRNEVQTRWPISKRCRKQWSNTKLLNTCIDANLFQSLFLDSFTTLNILRPSLIRKLSKFSSLQPLQDFLPHLEVVYYILHIMKKHNGCAKPDYDLFKSKYKMLLRLIRVFIWLFLTIVVEATCEHVPNMYLVRKLFAVVLTVYLWLYIARTMFL